MTNEVISNIPLGDIIPSGHNRIIGKFDIDKLNQLAASIKEIGVQQPAVVRVVDGGKFELVAGERRWRASAIAGVPTLPCVIRDLDNQAALRIQIVENLQREDVHPLDEADGYARLEKEGHCEVEYIAQQVGRSTAYVYQRLKLLQLIPTARKLLVDGVITAGHALLIARLPSTQQEEALDLATYNHGSAAEEDDIRSAKELDNAIRTNILMQLSSANWKLDDAKLYPLVGSCKECSKRSGASPLLFGDIGKKDQCLDKECFAEKKRRIVEVRKTELKGTVFLEVAGSWVHGENSPKGALEAWQWNECKKKDPGAVRVLVVGGADAGRMTWGKSRVTSSGKHIATPEEKAEKAKEKKLLAAGIELREKLFSGIALATVPELPEALLLEAVKEAWRQMNWDAKRLLSKQLGFVKRPEKYGDDRFEGTFQEYLVDKSRQELNTMLIMILYAGNLQLSNTAYMHLNARFLAAAKAAGIDVDKEAQAIAHGAGLEVEDILPLGRTYDEPEDAETGEGEEEDA